MLVDMSMVLDIFSSRFISPANSVMSSRRHRALCSIHTGSQRTAWLSWSNNHGIYTRRILLHASSSLCL